MSRRGVTQLQQLTLHYCPHGGSSVGARAFIPSQLRALAAENPGVQFATEVRKARHPYLSAEFANGNTHDRSVRNLDAEAILAACDELRNSRGGKAQKASQLRKWWSTRTPSLQGMWSPELFAPEGGGAGGEGGAELTLEQCRSIVAMDVQLCLQAAEEDAGEERMLSLEALAQLPRIRQVLKLAGPLAGGKAPEALLLEALEGRFSVVDGWVSAVPEEAEQEALDR